MMKVYLLQHVHRLEDGSDVVEDVKVIGIYSSYENAVAAQNRLITKPGFSLAADGFHIDEYPLDKDYWVDGYSVR